MKRVISYIMFLFLFAACERDMEFDVISVTDPSLTVVAETKTGTGTNVTITKISGATVNIYINQTDFNNSSTPYKTKSTGADGKAIFTKEDLGQKGIFYVRVTSAGKTGTGVTPYMLLNDGETTLFVELK
ncbi:hypothetical protein BA6E_10588 [Bacteroidales bacterium 6E]|nr:hypothetical protein BA6E_10588 [Bacteroidales bacterium 6E]